MHGAPSAASLVEETAHQPFSEPEGGGGQFPSPSPLRQRKNKRHSRLSYSLSGGGDDGTSQGGRADLSAAQETVFLNMYVRKMDRRIRGQHSNNSLCCEFAVVVVLSIIIVILGWDKTDEDDWQEADTIGMVTGLLWFAFAFIIFFVLVDSPYAKMLRYTVVYIPLLFFLASVSFHEEVRQEEVAQIRIHLGAFRLPSQYWSLALAIVAEALTFLGFLSYFQFGPRFVRSGWIRGKPGRVRRTWNIETIVEGDAWTMCYRGRKPHTCKYEGDIDEGTGLPDGLGRWIDDAWEGEMLTGHWKQGAPVAPFSSWSVGSDNAVAAVRVGYFKATDDVWSRNRFRPTNFNPPECGVAGVECSVSGSFYRHLPRVAPIKGPYVADCMPTRQNNPVREMLGHMFHVGEASDEDDGAIHIRAADARGVQVLGHLYAPTGRFYSPDAKSITVDVEWGSAGEAGRGDTSNSVKEWPDLSTLQSRGHSTRILRKSLFMPKPNTKSMAKKLVEVVVEDSSGEEISGDEDEGSNASLEEEKHSAIQMGHSSGLKTPSLHVHNWVPYSCKEALVFCPGYNSSMEACLNIMGQFLAMTKLSRRFYPIVFAWPAGFNLSYLYASKISATDTNRRNMLTLIRGLKEAGIHRVHFLTHSMGVQTLMGAFRDEYDEHGNGIGRSDVSKEFTLDPDFDTVEGPEEGRQQRNDNRMTCRSITLLNPDFPVKAFVDRGFLSVRRVCPTITVVGDRNDRALWWSSFLNAVAPSFGYKEAQVLWPTIDPNSNNKPAKWELVKRIGRSVEDLHFSPELAQRYQDSGNGEAFRRLLFNKAESGRQIDAHDAEQPLWLDMDVIDMTGLDTNIKGMRHSGFSLNGMLLKDLQELLSTGRRAMRRSTLLFREGNQFSFVRAPAFVSQ